MIESLSVAIQLKVTGHYFTLVLYIYILSTRFSSNIKYNIPESVNDFQASDY